MSTVHLRISLDWAKWFYILIIKLNWWLSFLFLPFFFFFWKHFLCFQQVTEHSRECEKAWQYCGNEYSCSHSIKVCNSLNTFHLCCHNSIETQFPKWQMHLHLHEVQALYLQWIRTTCFLFPCAALSVLFNSISGAADRGTSWSGHAVYCNCVTVISF